MRPEIALHHTTVVFALIGWLAKSSGNPVFSNEAGFCEFVDACWCQLMVFIVMPQSPITPIPATVCLAIFANKYGVT
jgi:hypothetical protein